MTQSTVSLFLLPHLNSGFMSVMDTDSMFEFWCMIDSDINSALYSVGMAFILTFGLLGPDSIILRPSTPPILLIAVAVSLSAIDKRMSPFSSFFTIVDLWFGNLFPNCLPYAINARASLNNQSRLNW